MEPQFCVLFTHRAAVIRLWGLKSAWWETATVTLSYLRVTRGSYRSCNPLWASSFHPSLSLLLKGKPRCASPAAAQLRETAQHPHARNLCSAGLLGSQSNGNRARNKTSGCYQKTQLKVIRRRWEFLPDSNKRRTFFLGLRFESIMIIVRRKYGSCTWSLAVLSKIPKKSTLEMMLYISEFHT